MTGKLVGICISKKRGTPKKPVQTAEIVKGWGIKGDAHGGDWHRQVSFLSKEKVDDFRKRGAESKNSAE